MLWKSQTQVSHSPCLQGACTERREKEIFKCLQCKRKKTHTHTKRSLVIDDSKVLSTSFKVEVRQWTGPRRMDRREHAEWSFQTQGITWVKRDWHLLKCRVCNLSCLVLHLGPLALYMTGNKHFIHAHWKLNEKETKFRAWMSLVSMTTQ